MVIHLKDGTQEYISDLDKLKIIARDRLGDDFAACLNDIIGAEIELAMENECRACREWEL